MTHSSVHDLSHRRRDVTASWRWSCLSRDSAKVVLMRILPVPSSYRSNIFPRSDLVLTFSAVTEFKIPTHHCFYSYIFRLPLSTIPCPYTLFSRLYVCLYFCILSHLSLHSPRHYYFIAVLAPPFEHIRQLGGHRQKDAEIYTKTKMWKLVTIWALLSIYSENLTNC